MTGNDMNHIEFIIPLFKSERRGLLINSFLMSNKIISIEKTNSEKRGFDKNPFPTKLLETRND
jgi:hypothetical protein